MPTASQEAVAPPEKPQEKRIEQARIEDDTALNPTLTLPSRAPELPKEVPQTQAQQELKAAALPTAPPSVESPVARPAATVEERMPQNMAIGAADPGDKGVVENAPGGVHLHSQAPGAGPTGGANTGAGAATPIDLSITVQPGRRSKKIAKPAAAKKVIGAAPAASFSQHNQAAPGAKFGPVRNAVGIPLGGGASSRGASGGQGFVPVRNAVGIALDSRASSQAAVAGHASGPVVDITSKTTVGAAIANAPGVGGGPTHAGPNGPSVSLNAVVPGGVAGHAAAIGGKDLVRPGSSSGSVGGAAKNMASINGTAMPRRCPGGC
jgi:hypothetical protein